MIRTDNVHSGRSGTTSGIIEAVVVCLVIGNGLVVLARASAPVGRKWSEPTEDKWPLAVSMGAGVLERDRSLFEATFYAGVWRPFLSIGVAERSRPYGEVAINRLLTVGVGVGSDRSDTNNQGTTVHWFVGLPLPLAGVGPDGLTTVTSFWPGLALVYLYVEPFYRPEWSGSAPVEHTFGLLVKVRVGITRRQWERPSLLIF